MKKILLIALISFLGAKTAFAFHDVTKFDIQGFRLGMTVDEVKKKKPDLEITKAVLPSGEVVGYYALYKKLLLRFTSDKKGAWLFFIVKYDMYRKTPDPYPIFTALTRKYGMPDYSGRDMWNIHACWGKCFGNHKQLKFTLKIAGIKGGFPLNVTLQDPGEDSINWQYFDLDSKIRSLAMKK